MITDCNLYSQTYVLEKNKIFINGYQLKHTLHVIYFTHYVEIKTFYLFILVQKTYNNSTVST